MKSSILKNTKLYAKNYIHISTDHIKANDDLQLTVLNIISTRWLSLSNVVSNLYQILDSIIDALNFDKINANDQRDKNRAAKVLELLDSKYVHGGFDIHSFHLMQNFSKG